MTKENAAATLNNLLQLVTYYDQKRALARQQMMVCNQCPKMKEYQDAAKDADIAFDKYKAQYTLAEMSQKNADLSVTNATLNSQGAELSASRGVESVTSLTQDLTAAEKTCDDKYPEEEVSKEKYNIARKKVETFETTRKDETTKEMNVLLKERRSKSYYLSTHAGSHIDMGTKGYDVVASETSGAAMTVSLWIKLTSLGQDSTLISSRGENGGQIFGWSIGVNSQDGFYFDVTIEGDAKGKVITSRMKSGSNAMELTMNEWYYVAVTWGEEKKLFVNGYNVARGKGGTIMYESLTNVADAGVKSHAGRSLTIGALNDGTKWFNGGMDNVALWSRELAAEELQKSCTKKDTTKNVVELSGEKLFFFLNFGPDFDLGTNVTSTVAGMEIMEGSVIMESAATWIPDDDGKVFCGALTNTMGRKVIRRLSEKTAYMRVTKDIKCSVNTTVCVDDKCSPTSEGGIAVYFQNELFGNGAGQIPNPDQKGKKISNVELLLSLGSDAKEDDVWNVQTFIMNDNEVDGGGGGCVMNSVKSGNTTVEIVQFERDEGRVTVDMTDQLRELARATSGSVKGVYITRADTTTPDSVDLYFMSSTFSDAKKRPQLIVGVTDGESPPINFLKGQSSCKQGTHKMCTYNEVESSVGFDGYDERRCGKMMKDDKKENFQISLKNSLETCENNQGVFCCAV